MLGCLNLCHLPLLHLPEGDGWLPSNTVLCNTDFGIKLVNLLEGEALCFVDHEVDKNNTDKAAAAPDEKYLGLEVGISMAVVDQVRGRVGKGPVEEPVGGCGHGERFGTDFEGKYFAGYNPAQLKHKC